MRKITEETQDNDFIKLKRGAKGVYGWEITIYGIEYEKILKKIKNIDAKLREDYGE